MAYALELDHVGKSYDHFELQDIKFKLEEGLILGLIGTNGAGKTTLIQIILGLLNSTGDIRIYGHDTKKEEKLTKDLCGFILDENPFLSSVSPMGNAKIFGPCYSGWDEEQFKQYCNKFNVPLKKPLQKLSQGTIIKFQIAFALSHNAKLLVLDEPSAGLDPIFRRELIDMMYDIIMEGERSIIFSTHLTHDLDNVADYVLMIHEGKQLFATAKDDLVEQYSLIRGSADDINSLPVEYVVGKKHTNTYSEALIQGYHVNENPRYTSMRPMIEDIMYYVVEKEKNKQRGEHKDD